MKRGLLLALFFFSFSVGVYPPQLVAGSQMDVIVSSGQVPFEFEIAGVDVEEVFVQGSSSKVVSVAVPYVPALTLIAKERGSNVQAEILLPVRGYWHPFFAAFVVVMATGLVFLLWIWIARQV